MQALAPTPQSSATGRVLKLDALRGLAVIGIAWMNVYIFALPHQAYYNPVAFAGEGSADRLVWLFSFVFVEDKFRTLFAMLFGAGCLILLEREDERPWRAHTARMTVLFAIGLGHSIALASNDVLRLYALAGMAIPLMKSLSSPRLYAIAIGLLALHVGGGVVAFGGALVDFYAGRPSTDAIAFAERNFGRDPAAIEYALRLGHEGFIDRIARRSAAIPSQFSALAFALPLNLAAMTLGMAFWRDRMLAGEWRTFRLQRFATLFAIISIPALLGMSAWVAAAGFPGALVGPVALVISAPFDTLLGLTYAFLVMALLTSEGSITRRLAAVGRLSLTNYIATSLIFAALFADWGLGLFAAVSRAQAFALSFVPIAAMLIWSQLWLQRMGAGPLELLWRRAARALS
ncbi:MAG: DUF418 domain-containing protein [Pseudomonadota bacterium]